MTGRQTLETRGLELWTVVLGGAVPATKRGGHVHPGMLDTKSGGPWLEGMEISGIRVSENLFKSVCVLVALQITYLRIVNREL